MGPVLGRKDLILLRQQWREGALKVVFTNGCYDLLHPGHVRLLERARSLGDRLAVAVNSDSSVRRLKGAARPVLPEQERAALLAAMAAVDAVTIFEEDTPCELLAKLLPDILVKGADWAHWVAGREIVEAAGGAVMALPVEPEYSTTDIVNKILELPR
ncbi:MAG: D-glycero-beta-D-manno-heptose 1-phosphate adenylyltransferase [Acidobacteria bacterium]|nr:D-glycero-beta-D-manno-heptose 1-phosphate adenylyltransferase [Acidobacteriota bacterium]